MMILKEKNVGLSSSSVTPFINFYGLAKKKGGTYPFIVLNTDRSNLPGIH